MRKLFLLLTITFLLQSCFTYKQMDVDPSKMVVDQKYKIERNHKVSKVIFKRVSDSSIVVLKRWKEQQIPLKEISNIRKRKFSIVKTIALIPITTVGLIIVFVVFNPNLLNYGFGEIRLPP